MSKSTDKPGAGEKPNKAAESGDEALVPADDDKTILAGDHSADSLEPISDANRDGLTVIVGAPGEAPDDDKTLFGDDHSAGIIEPMSDANRDGLTVIAGGGEPDDDRTLMPGDRSADAAAGSVGEDDATIVNEVGTSDTATLGIDEHPEGATPVTRQDLKAQRATVIGEAAKGGSGEQQGGSGDRIVRDRFVILERIGKGGMGEIYKARDLRKEEAQDDNPYVAIKFLGEAFSQHPRALISLQREAKRSQQLAHPNVVTVYDFDRDGDRVYMTMEYLKGAPLGGWDSIKFLEGREPSIHALIEDMSNGLIYAHEQGVVHSDLKPDNVFVTVEGRVKLLDFGIARIMDSALQKDSFDAGELSAMTMRYASLEMLEGGKDPHPADDVYALGVMAYQLFAGDHPYQGKNALDAKKLGIVPPPLKGLRRHQRKAIEGAIALERDHRTKSVDQFLSKFTGSRRRNIALLIAVFVLTLSSGYFAYEASLREGPSVPFEELPATVQEDFLRNIDLGQKSSGIEDWDGASRYYIAAYELHPRNPVAEQGLESLAQHLVEVAAGLESPRQKQYLLVMLQGYSGNEYLASHEALSAERLRLEAEMADREK